MPDVDKLEAGPELDDHIAETFYGWRWMAWVATPIRGTPGYPRECRVRAFISPEQIAATSSWPVFRVSDGGPAKGDEPLHYWYCSSQFPCAPDAYSTDFTAAMDLNRIMQKRRFSIRQAYYHEIQVAVWQRRDMSFVPAWPDVMGLMEPVDICRAAVKAAEKGGA